MKYKFDDIAYNITQKRAPKKEDSLKYIGLEHLDSGSLTVNRYGLDVDLKGDKLVMKKGDILLGKRNAYLRRAAIAPHDGLFSAHGMVLRPKEDVIDKDYFPFFVSSDRFFDEVIRISVGGLSPTVNWRDLKELEFDLPPLDQQKLLANKLWAAYEVKQSYLRMIEATEKMVKSQFIEMFYSQNNYDKVSLTSVSDFQGGAQPPKKDWISKPTPGYIRMLQIRDFTQSEKDNVEYVKISKSLKICDENDILIGRYGASVGKILTGLSGAYNVAIMKTIPDANIINLMFFKHYLLSDYFQNNIIRVGNGRGAQAGFNKDDLSSFMIPLPPMVEQKKFEGILRQADQAEFESRKSIVAIDKVIKSLINENL